jgi:hypothetical protein
MLLGRPVATAPLSEAEQTAYAHAKTSLAEGAPKLEGDVAQWREPLRLWIERRSAIVRELDEALQRLPEADRNGLFAAIVSGVAMDDLVTDIIALPLPVSAKQSEFARDIEVVFRESLEQLAAPLAKTTRERLAVCAALAGHAAPAMLTWSDHCRVRGGKLAELEQRVAARPAPKRSDPRPKALDDCKGSEKIVAEPDGEPPDKKVKPRIVLLYDTGYAGGRLSGENLEQLLAGVRRKLKDHAKVGLLSEGDVKTAQALVAQKRMSSDGPVCGQPPRLTQVLAAKYRNLIVAKVSTNCVIDDRRPTDCLLTVWFKRAGTWDHDGLPKKLEAPVTADDPASWIAAANKLSTDVTKAGVLGSLLGGSSDRVLELKDYGDDDPWMRLGDVLRTDTEPKLAACVDAPASFDVKLSISSTGATTSVALTPVTAAKTGSKVEACVKDALQATGFPCTHDGKPVEVAFRACVAPKQR